MTTSTPSGRRRFVGSALALAFGRNAFAGEAPVSWSPHKPIDFLVSFPPGGTADTLARLIATRAGERAKWQFVPMNRPGAGGQILQRALQAAPVDGHTIGLCASYELTYTSTDRPQGAASIDDFTYLAGLARSPMSLVARPDAGLDTLDKMRAHARRKGVLTIGVAPPFDWLAPAFGAALGVPTVGAPYKGSAELMPALLGGHLDLSISAGGHIPYEKAGTLKVVAVMTKDRLPRNPGLPSLHEQGIDLIVESRFLILGPKRLAAEPAQQIARVFADVLRDPAAQQQIADQLGLVPAYLSGEELGRSLRADAALARQYQAAALAKK